MIVQTILSCFRCLFCFVCKWRAVISLDRAVPRPLRIPRSAAIRSTVVSELCTGGGGGGDLVGGDLVWPLMACLRGMLLLWGFTILSDNSTVSKKLSFLLFVVQNKTLPPTAAALELSHARSCALQRHPWLFAASTVSL